MCSWASGRRFRGFERDFSKVLNHSLATVEMTNNQADYMVHGPCSYGCAYGAGPNLNRKIILLWRRSGWSSARVACRCGRVSLACGCLWASSERLLVIMHLHIADYRLVVVPNLPFFRGDDVWPVKLLTATHRDTEDKVLNMKTSTSVHKSLDGYSGKPY